LFFFEAETFIDYNFKNSIIAYYYFKGLIKIKKELNFGNLNEYLANKKFLNEKENYIKSEFFE
jgi:hypothetical protein